MKTKEELKVYTKSIDSFLKFKGVLEVLDGLVIGIVLKAVNEQAPDKVKEYFFMALDALVESQKD